MIIVNYTCPKCGAHILASYDVNVTANRIFVACGNCDALIELAETRLEPKEPKGGKDE